MEHPYFAVFGDGVEGAAVILNNDLGNRAVGRLEITNKLIAATIVTGYFKPLRDFTVGVTKQN